MTHFDPSRRVNFERAGHAVLNWLNGLASRNGNRVAATVTKTTRVGFVTSHFQGKIATARSEALSRHDLPNENKSKSDPLSRGLVERWSSQMVELGLTNSIAVLAECGFDIRNSRQFS